MENLFTIKEIDISYSNSTIKTDRKTIKSSFDAKDIFKSAIANTIEYNETFMVLALNNSNEVLGIKKIGVGGITATLVDVRLLFQTVLKAHATGFIVCHNHPSGKTTPSTADKKLTQKIKEAATLLDLNFLDHLIITKNDALSFADENLL